MTKQNETVTLGLKTYESLVRNERMQKLESENKKLIKLIEDLQKDISEKLNNNEYIVVKQIGYYSDKHFYFIKDKKPNWIKRFFN